MCRRGCSNLWRKSTYAKRHGKDNRDVSQNVSRPRSANFLPSADLISSYKFDAILGGAEGKRYPNHMRWS